MRLFEKLKKNEIPIDWTTILCGWQGLDHFDSCITTEEVIAFASEKLIDPKIDQKEIVRIAIAEANEREIIYKNLYTLSIMENGNTNRSIRIWTVIMLEDLLDMLGDDPFDDLLKIRDFWLRAGILEEGPYKEPEWNKENNQGYFTVENLQIIKSECRKWNLKEKIDLLSISFD